MKRTIVFIMCLVLACSLSACANGKIRHPYEQEYIAGQGNIKGNVDTAEFFERDKRFEIGATMDGYAVFKDPDKAYEALLENYSEGLKLIADEHQLSSVSKDNYQAYKKYGAQITTGSAEAQEQAHFISKFFDIYENSYD
ncbi:MAG: hypothetical protein IKE36_01055 [Solobacterium sp.]|nr:hypothetical protein [Solobacterium sp.]